MFYWTIACRGGVLPVDAEEEATSELLVFLQAGADAAAFAQDHQLNLTQSLVSDTNAHVFSASSPQAAQGVYTALGGDARVRSSGFNRRTGYVRMGFVPNDPYFYKDTPSAGQAGQWHLINAVNPGRDIGVQEAWMRNITGAGVTIGIVDDSLQIAHPDLAPNHASSDSFDFGQNDNDPSPVFGADDHGTSVAGLAAARGGNGIGVTGAAPFAGLAGLRIDFFDQTTAMFVEATKYHSSGANTSIKVKNHSYGYSVPYVPGVLEQQALAESTAAGTIHVMAAGNNRGVEANKLDLQNSPDSITVGAMGSNGSFAWYSSFGANVFVTAPSHGQILSPAITTTDRTDDDGYNPRSDPFADWSYTDDFGGTSASSPQVAGVMAMGKQAQPNLNTRFAKHVMVLTNDIIDPANNDFGSDGGWKTNGAGNIFNQNYGFGLINATEFSLESTQFSGVTPLQTETTGPISVNAAVPDNDLTGITRAFDISSTTPLEEVLVTLDVTHTFRGDLEAHLRSPAGTTSRLMYRNRGDEGENLHWTYLSNAFWGEDPSGTWSITLADAFVFDDGVWNFFDFTARMGELIAAIPGDTNYDGTVDLVDLGILAGNYGRTEDALWKFGDFDLDFDVDLTDLGMLAAHYAAGSDQAYADFESIAAVPEPTVALGAVSAAFILMRRSRLTR